MIFYVNTRRLPYMDKNIQLQYEMAKELYAKFGIDTDEVLKKLSEIKISMHCWQGDDVRGFINKDQELTGGIQVTGNYPGVARTPDELRQDLEKAFSLIPGKHKVNLHALYTDTDEKIDFDEIEPHHYKKWVQWAKEQGLGLDFNPSFFSHPKADSGFTLSSPDREIRDFWIEHGKRSRRVAEYFGKELGQTAVNNVWIPDGFKDNPVDRLAPRERLMNSLDEMLSEDINEEYMQDAVESKLFGIGAEAYTVGSHEFYMGYALSRNKYLCLDAGHFHPTEVVSNKLSSVSLFAKGILLHVSRPMRWDSDHVVTMDDELQEIANELIRHNLVDKTAVGLDFFDATINRVAAWVIGTRNTIKALMRAMLEPTDMLKNIELEGDYTTRLALMEELKSYPFGAIWDYYCAQQGVPVREAWLQEVKTYEEEVLTKR